MANMNTVLKAYRFPLILFCSIVFGCVIGIVFGKNALCLKPLGDIFINAMFMVVVPLVFSTICSSVAGMSSLERLRKVLRCLLVTFFVTSCLISLYMLLILHYFPLPAITGLNIGEVSGTLKAVSGADTLVNAFTTDDFVNLLSRKAMLPMIIFTIFFGVCLNSLGERAKCIVIAINIMSDTMLKMVGYIMYYAPIGLCAYFACLMANYGTMLISVYFSAMLRCYIGGIFYFFVIYTIYAWFATNGKGVAVFWKNIIAPAVTAIGTTSSSATLPVNLKAMNNMHVPEDISGLVLPVGATVHMEGACLYLIIGIVFMFNLYGVPFEGVKTLIVAVASAVLCSIVASGIPGGGFVGETLLVSIYGLPAEAFPILITITILTDPLDTMLNVTGDSCSALLVSRFVEGKDWFEKAWGNGKC